MNSSQSLDQVDAARVFVYNHTADVGLPPSSAAIADHFGCTAADALEMLKAIAARKALTLDPATGEIWMAHPFSARRTAFHVHGDRTSWWANCSWDMLGIPATLGVSARIEAHCGCCHEPMHVAVDAQRGPVSGDGLVHFLVPARQWYQDIGFT